MDNEKKVSFLEAFKEQNQGNNLLDLDRLTRITSTEVESELQQKREEIAAAALKNAIDTAARLQPQEKSGSDNQYLAPIAARFKENESMIHKRLQTKGLERHKKQILEIKEQQLQDSKAQKAKLNNEIVNKERYMRTKYAKKPAKVKTNKLGAVLVVFILLSEWIYNASSFQGLGLSFIKSAIVSFGVVAALAGFGYKFLEEYRLVKRSISRLWGFGSLIIGCFFAIAFLRIYFIKQIGGDESMSMVVGTLVFVVINAVLFGGSSFFFDMFFPTKEARQKYKEYEDEVKELDTLKAGLKTVEAKEAELHARVAKNIQEADDLIDYTNELLKSNLASYRTVATEWRREVALRLPHTPDCFKNDIPELTCELVVRDDDSLLGTKSINA